MSLRHRTQKLIQKVKSGENKHLHRLAAHGITNSAYGCMTTATSGVVELNGRHEWEIEKPVTIQSLINKYNECEDKTDIRELCYHIMDVIANTTADSIELEEQRMKQWELQEKKKAEKKERQLLLKPTYGDARELKTMTATFCFSEAFREWVCQHCGYKVKTEDYKTTKEILFQHNCKGVKIEAFNGDKYGLSNNAEDYMSNM